MIHVLLTNPHRYTIRTFIEGAGRALRGRLRYRPYKDSLTARRHPRGTYVFADLERLDAESLERADALHARLSAEPERYRVLNDPLRSLRRPALMRALHEAGVNDFNAYAVGETPHRWPVFLRDAIGHSEAALPLLADKQALAHAAAGLDRRDDTLVVEFLDTRDDAGVYRKYSAFRIGDAVFARHVFFSHQWLIKNAELAEPDLLAEELACVRDNPHAEDLLLIFNRAGIDYGRIDYTLHHGRIQVWEINTNPMIMSDNSFEIPERRPVQEQVLPRLIEAFQSIDSGPGNWRGMLP